MRLIRPVPHPAPRQAGWLVAGDNCTDLQLRVVLRAFLDVGIREVPPGSNRGTRIDRYLRRANVPEDLIERGRGWWCAAAAGAWLLDCGVPVPSDYAATKSWLPFIGYDPAPGAIILYGVGGVPHHIGVLVRTEPAMDSIEGNRAFAGSTSNNGVACDYGPVNRTDILGYATPESLIAAFARQAAA